MVNTIDFFIGLINKHFGEGTARPSDIPSRPPCLIVDSTKILMACRLLHDDPSASFDMLECISGIDNGPEAGTMEVIYHLHSVLLENQIALRVILKRPVESGTLPELDSVAGIWRTADWLERETFDLIGIKFTGHPDLRRILLPHDWTGHPLRKDYKTDDYYHHVKIDY